MRTAKIELDGKEYLLCFSARVIRACAERYGDVSGLGDALDNEDRLKAMDEAMWILSKMIDGGARYAALNGIENPNPLSVDELYDTSDISDFSRIKLKIMEAVTNGKRKTVEVAPPKNT